MNKIISPILAVFFWGCSSTPNKLNTDYANLGPNSAEYVAQGMFEIITKNRIAKRTSFVLDRDDTVSLFLFKKLRAAGFGISTTDNMNSTNINWVIQPLNDSKGVVFARFMVGNKDYSQLYRVTADNIEPISKISQGNWE